jgi:hypothetical protein
MRFHFDRRERPDVNDYQPPLDSRLVLLARAAARMMLLELGEIDIEDACEGLADDMWTADSEAKSKPFDPATARVRRLLAPDISLDQAWHALNCNRATPGTTIEAIKVAVRDRGVAALKEPATRERMQRCDAAARADVERWLSRFKK